MQLVSVGLVLELTSFPVHDILAMSSTPENPLETMAMLVIVQTRPAAIVRVLEVLWSPIGDHEMILDARHVCLHPRGNVIVIHVLHEAPVVCMVV